MVDCTCPRRFAKFDVLDQGESWGKKKPWWHNERPYATKTLHVLCEVLVESVLKCCAGVLWKVLRAAVFVLREVLCAELVPPRPAH